MAWLNEGVKVTRTQQETVLRVLEARSVRCISDLASNGLSRGAFVVCDLWGPASSTEHNVCKGHV